MWRPGSAPGPRHRGRSTAPTRASSFYDFPAEHWIHLRTTNPVESTFSTVKLRTKVTRGAGCRPRDGVQAGGFAYEVDGREVQFVRPADTSDMAWAVYGLGQYRGMVYAEPHRDGRLWRLSASAARHRELAEAVRALRQP